LLIDISRPSETSVAAELSPITPTARSDTAAFDQAYYIGPKDVLDITVYRETDLSGKFSVSPDGVITFPLIGQVKAQGYTTAELSDVMRHLLSQGYLVNPQVSVEVAVYQSQQVLTLGAVQNPGHFYLGGKTTLLEMLSRAGGLSHHDGQSHFLILFRQRTASGTEVGDGGEDVQTMHIDLERLLDQGDMSLNVPLQGQDVIYVPQPASILVFGEVKNPGPISLSGKNMTLVEAISKAGGFTKIAAPSRTKVIRMIDGVERAKRINVADIIKRGDRSKDVVLEPNDIVVVPESIF
jgi:polysaccharide export outer membrane protein